VAGHRFGFRKGRTLSVNCGELKDAARRSKAQSSLRTPRRFALTKDASRVNPKRSRACALQSARALSKDASRVDPERSPACALQSARALSKDASRVNPKRSRACALQGARALTKDAFRVNPKRSRACALQTRGGKPGGDQRCSSSRTRAVMARAPVRMLGSTAAVKRPEWSGAGAVPGARYGSLVPTRNMRLGTGGCCSR